MGQFVSDNIDDTVAVFLIRCSLVEEDGSSSVRYKTLNQMLAGLQEVELRCFNIPSSPWRRVTRMTWSAMLSS